MSINRIFIGVIINYTMCNVLELNFSYAERLCSMSGDGIVIDSICTMCIILVNNYEMLGYTMCIIRVITFSYAGKLCSMNRD